MESLLLKTMNEISIETLVDWYYLMEHNLENIKYKFRNSDKLDWQQISQMSLTENFITEFQDKVNWTCISNHLPLNEEFIIKFQDKRDWEAASNYDILSGNFIRKFQDKLNWNSISRYQSLTSDLIREFQDKVNWR